MSGFGQKTLCIGEQRRQLDELFRKTVLTLADSPILIFTWSPASSVGEIGWDRIGKVQVRINLRAFSGHHFRTDSGRRFFAGYVCLYLTRHLSAMEAANRIPRTYLEGLAHLESLFRQEERRKFPIYCLWPGGPRGRRFCFTPASLFCASAALEEAGKRWGGLLSDGESEILSKSLEELSVMAALPEIGYYKGPFPESSLIWTIRQTGKLLKRCPALPDRAAVLGSLVWDADTLCTPEQLLVRWEETGDSLCLGLALRLLTLSGGLASMLKKGSAGLRSAADTYCRDCVRLAKLCRASHSVLLSDTLAAAEKIAAPLNRGMEQAEVRTRFGTVRPMGDAWR